MCLCLGNGAGRYTFKQFVCSCFQRWLELVSVWVDQPSSTLGAASTQGPPLNYRKVCSAQGFPGGTSGKEPACQCKRHKRCRFNPWVGKIPWRRAWQPTPVFLPGEPHGQRTWWATVHRVAKSKTWLKQFSMHAHGLLAKPQAHVLKVVLLFA